MPVLCSVNYQFPHCLFEIPGKVRKMVNPIGDDLLMMFSCYFFLFIRLCCGLIPKTYTERVMKMQCYTYDNGPIIGLMSIDPAHVTITSCFSFLFGFPLWHLFQVSSQRPTGQWWISLLDFLLYFYFFWPPPIILGLLLFCSIPSTAVDWCVFTSESLKTRVPLRRK